MKMDKRIPVVTLNSVEETAPVLKALKAYGINCAEITFRTACAEEAIKAAVKEFPDMNIGAGTVINGGQCRRALATGAKFIVSPGLSEEVAGICREAGVPLHHVKPHVALYNMAAQNRPLADAICQAVQAAAPGAVLLALSGSEMVAAAQAIGLPVACEVFADRGYRPDGTLVPRGEPGAMIEDENEAIARVLQMAREGVVPASGGALISLQADSVCVHGDQPQALRFVQKLRAALPAAGIALQAF